MPSSNPGKRRPASADRSGATPDRLSRAGAGTRLGGRAPGVEAAVEASTNLTSWNDYYVFTDDPGFPSDLVVESTPVPGGTRIFLRVPNPAGAFTFLRYFRVRVDPAGD